MSKCHCGYELRFPGEQELLDQWGCARALVKRSGPFNSLEVSMCTHDGKGPTGLSTDDGSSLTEAYKDKYKTPEKPKDDTKPIQK